MAVDLTSALRKLDWATEHLYRLDEAIGRYLDGIPEPAPLLNYQADGKHFCVEVPAPAEPSGDLSLIVGDMVHNARAFLDYIAWQLVLANGGTPTDRTQFPIYNKAVGPKGGSRTIEPAGGVGAAVLAVLESLQPYNQRNDPENHPLAILQQLSNIDKHRRLNPVSGRTTSARIIMRVDGLEVPFPPVDPPVRTEQNTYIVGVGEARGGTPLRDDVEMEVDGSFYVVLEEVLPTEPVGSLLYQIIKYGRDVVLAALTPFLS